MSNERLNDSSSNPTDTFDNRGDNRGESSDKGHTSGPNTDAYSSTFNSTFNSTTTCSYYSNSLGHSFRPIPSLFHSFYFIGKKCAVCNKPFNLVKSYDDSEGIQECYTCDVYVHTNCRSRVTNICEKNR